MSSDPKDQKTLLAQEAPAVVKQAVEQKTLAAPASQAGGMASNLPPPPAPPPPTGTAPAPAHQATLMAEAPMAQTNPRVVPTLMKQRPAGGGVLPPVPRPRRESTWGRWVAGPLLSISVAAGTVALMGVALPLGPKIPPPKPQGRIQLKSDPPGASVLIDGKVHPHFTPTFVEADVGATLHVQFRLDGYASREADVGVLEGEHPFAAKLERLADPPAPAPAAVARKERKAAAPKTPEPVRTGTLSVFVRPWAIVYVDGSRLRQTPVQGFELPAGKHTIELVNEGKNLHEKLVVDLAPGGTEEIRRDWDK